LCREQVFKRFGPGGRGRGYSAVSGSET
jgi:hypothetical protein